MFSVLMLKAIYLSHMQRAYLNFELESFQSPPNDDDGPTPATAIDSEADWEPLPRLFGGRLLGEDDQPVSASPWNSDLKGGPPSPSGFLTAALQCFLYHPYL